MSQINTDYKYRISNAFCNHQVYPKTENYKLHFIRKLDIIQKA